MIEQTSPYNNLSTLWNSYNSGKGSLKDMEDYDLGKLNNGGGVIEVFTTLI